MSKHVSKGLFIVTLMIFTSFFISCNEQEQMTPDMNQALVATPKTTPIVEVKEFVAPADQMVSAEQAKKYVKASAALVELGAVWTNRIDNAPENDKIQILNAYNVARDQLCARIGLAGIAEYNWITTVALKNPRNKPVFEANGLSIP